MQKPRFRKNPDGTFTRISDEDAHRAEVHEQKARNHLTAAAQLRGEEPEAPEGPPMPDVKTTTPKTYQPERPKPGRSKAEIDAFVRACESRNRSLN